MSRNSAPGAGIDGAEGEDFLNRGKDDGNKPARDISTREFKQACNPWDEPTWKPGPVKQGNSPPRYAPKGDAGTKSPEAYEPTGKYAKRAGVASGRARNTVKEKPSLEDRINDLAAECRRFVRDRAIEASKGTGVPAISNEMMLMQAGDGSPFYAALRVIETLKREREIADREWQKEHAARQSA